MKIALCFGGKQLSPERIVRNMLATQVQCDFHKTRVMELPGGCVGCIHTSDQFSSIPLFRQSAGGNWLMMAGVPIRMDGSLDETLRLTVENDYRAAQRSLADLDGAYAAVFWDAGNRKLVIVSDFLGMEPLYIHQTDETLLVASEIKAITTGGGVPVEMDAAGWGSLISLGHVIGNRTLVDRVHRVDAGTVLVYDPSDRTLERSTYWRWPQPDPGMTLDKVDTGELVDALRQDILAYTQHLHPGTVLMSGGFDSRIILAILREQGFHPETLIVSHKDELWDADCRFALQTTKLFQTDSRVVSPSPSFYSSPAYLDYLAMNEVMTPSLYLFIAQVCSFVRSLTGAVWEGAAPAYTFRLPHQPAGGFENYRLQECAGLESKPWKAAFEIFGRERAVAMHDAFGQLLREECGKYSDDGYGVFEYLVRNRMRNRTAPNPLKVYANYVLPFTPGFTRRMWNLAGQIPYETKAGYAMYRRILSRHFPKAAELPIVSSTTVFPGKSPIRGGWGTWMWSAFENNRMLKIAKKLTGKVVRGSWTFWQESAFVPRVLAAVAAEHSDLDSQGVRRICGSSPGMYKGTTYRARHLLFYWQAWRWIMAGDKDLARKLEAPEHSPNP